MSLDAEINGIESDVLVGSMEQTTRQHDKRSVLDDGLSDDERLELLADLSPIEYDKARDEAAKLLGVRSSTLDKTVANLQKTENGREMAAFPEIEPWHDSVDLAALLTEASGTIQRFIICNEETAHAAALWVAMSWSIDNIQVCPLAVITAPEKRCGKSQLLFLLGKLVRRPLTASNISPAALFRSIDAWQPTLLVDEADAFMRDNEELRGILNAGHTRDSAYIVRVVGDDHTPKMFNVWGAKAIAGIGHLADTIMDRSVILELRRKMPHENVERLRHAEPGLFDDLAAKFARSADDHREAIRKSRPNLPTTLNDRAQDNWEPLLAIAEVAGGDWPALARQAAVKLSGTNDGGSVSNELLADIQEIIQGKGLTRISTADLIKDLCADEEKPWATYNRGRQIAPRQVASKLKSYGVLSQTIRIGMGTAKGYLSEQFEEAFARYLFSPPLSATSDEHGAAGGHPHNVTDNPSRYRYENPYVTRKPNAGRGCDVVTDRGSKPTESENREIEL